MSNDKIVVERGQDADGWDGWAVTDSRSGQPEATLFTGPNDEQRARAYAQRLGYQQPVSVRQVQERVRRALGLADVERIHSIELQFPVEGAVEARVSLYLSEKQVDELVEGGVLDHAVKTGRSWERSADLTPCSICERIPALVETPAEAMLIVPDQENAPQCENPQGCEMRRSSRALVNAAWNDLQVKRSRQIVDDLHPRDLVEALQPVKES